MMKRFLALVLVVAMTVPAAAAEKPVKVQPVRGLGLTVDHSVTVQLSAPASSVFIANPDIADVQVMSPTTVTLFGKRTGDTTFTAVDNAGHTLMQRHVSVTQDLSGLRRELVASFPGNNIRASSVPNGIVLTGDAKDAATVADAYRIAQRYIPEGGDIINRMKVSGSNQINIRVRFAEVQRNIDNSFGIDWGNLASIGGFMFGIASGATVNTTLQGTATGSNMNGLFPRPNNTALSLPNGVLGFSRQGQRFNINGMIDALAQEGLITVLAEPNLSAMSGETANFLAGGEFPIPIPQGNGTLSIEFKKYGVSLSFTPTLLGQDRISLHVKPEVSELTTNGSIVLSNITVPAITTRRAETTVEVASGQSFAIAGLLDNNQTQTVNKYPLLGDLPILGALFRSDRFQRGQTELVIIITPYIVTPNGEQMLAMPTDGFASPTEYERYVGLRTSSADPQTRPMSGLPVGVSGAAQPPALPAPAAMPVQPVSEVPKNEPTPAAVMVPMKRTEIVPETAPAATPVEQASTSLRTVPMSQVAENKEDNRTEEAAVEPANWLTPLSTKIDDVKMAAEPAKVLAPAPASAPSVIPAPKPVAVVPPPMKLNPVRVSSSSISPQGRAPAGQGGFILE